VGHQVALDLARVGEEPAQPQRVAADPDAAMMRLEPEMREPAGEGPRLGGADR